MLTQLIALAIVVAAACLLGYFVDGMGDLL